MNENKLKALLESEIDASIGYVQSETTDQRQEALDFYLRQPYGNEVEGRSQIVTGEVAEVVDAALPQLLRIFTAGDDVVNFEPVAPGDEPLAKQATDYCNWIFYRDNPGFQILHHWFKDALISKVGIVKACYDYVTDTTVETYQNLTGEELALLLADESIEVVSQDATLVEQTDPMGNVIQMESYDVAVRKKRVTGRVQIENVPPEEFLISKRARTIEDSPFVAHRKLVSRSDLVAMGYDATVVANLATYDSLSFTPERTARFSQGEQPHEAQSYDSVMQEVEVFECYVRADVNDDGVAELLRVVYASNDILDAQEYDHVPFHSLCPIPIPHKFYGQSLAERAMDIQLQKSTITRQMLDNLYLTNNSRVGAVEGQVNLDDLLSSTPGGVVRMKNPNAVVPLQVAPVAQQAFPMLEYLDQVQTKRTGVNEAMGLDPNILQNVTATAIASFQNASGSKLELIARIFAETGVKSLFRGILQLVCKYQDKPRIIRLRDQYVPMDPRMWSNQYDVQISVGLGTGSRQEQLAMLSMILDKQERILAQQGPANPLVSMGQYRETLGRLIEAAGFKDSAAFFKPITPQQDQMLSNPPPQQPQPDPQLQMMMAQAQAQMEIDKARLAAEIQAKREKAEADIRLEREKMAAQMELKRAEFEAEVQLKAAQVGAGIANNIEIPGNG